MRKVNKYAAVASVVCASVAFNANAFDFWGWVSSFSTGAKPDPVRMPDTPISSSTGAKPDPS